MALTFLFGCAEIFSLKHIWPPKISDPIYGVFIQNHIRYPILALEASSVALTIAGLVVSYIARKDDLTKRFMVRNREHSFVSNRLTSLESFVLNELSYRPYSASASVAHSRRCSKPVSSYMTSPPYR